MKEEDLGITLVKIGAVWFLICLVIAMFTYFNDYEVSFFSVFSVVSGWRLWLLVCFWINCFRSWFSVSIFTQFFNIFIAFSMINPQKDASKKRKED